MVWYGHPLEIWEQQLQKDPGIAVVCNRDYEPSAIARDNQVEALCGIHNTAFLTFKDHCIFEKSEVTKDDGKPYTVFTPYSRKWKLHLAQVAQYSARQITQERQNFHGHVSRDQACFRLSNLAHLTKKKSLILRGLLYCFATQMLVFMNSCLINRSL